MTASAFRQLFPRSRRRSRFTKSSSGSWKEFPDAVCAPPLAKPKLIRVTFTPQNREKLSVDVTGPFADVTPDEE